MATPCAVVLSCADLPASDLVKQIVGTKDLPPSKPLVDTIIAYPWHIETKYYTAEVSLCTIDEKSIGNLQFAESVQAVIIYFDSQKESSFVKVKEWMSFVKEYAAEILILVCEKCSNNDVVNKNEIQQWCLQNSFELVELHPEDENDCDDDFPETTGLKRIIQALHSHLWPNLEMKETRFGSTLGSILNHNSSPHPVCEEVDSLADQVSELKMQEETNGNETESDEAIQSSAIGASALNDEKLSRETFSYEAMFDDVEMFQVLGTDDPGGQSFEALFQQFHQMKEKAKVLPFEERKLYAEKVAIAFWHAIGGDDEEIEGLEECDLSNT